jgi:hypothetical protein
VGPGTSRSIGLSSKGVIKYSIIANYRDSGLDWDSKETGNGTTDDCRDEEPNQTDFRIAMRMLMNCPRYLPFSSERNFTI